MIVKRREYGQRYTKEEICKVLQDLPSSDGGYNNLREIYYYIHLDTDGNILDGCRDAEETFVRKITNEDYGLTEEEWDNMDCEWIFDQENLSCKAFADTVEDLTDQVNDYLSDLDGFI